MKKILFFCVISCIYSVSKSQDECGIFSNINNKLLLQFSVAEMNFTTNYYYQDTCCVALELFNESYLPKITNSNKILILESSFFISSDVKNQKISLVLDISNCEKRIFLNGKLIGYFSKNISNCFTNLLIKLELPNNLINYDNISNELTIQIYPNKYFDYKYVDSFLMENKYSDNYIFEHNFLPLKNTSFHENRSRKN